MSDFLGNFLFSGGIISGAVSVIGLILMIFSIADSEKGFEFGRKLFLIGGILIIMFVSLLFLCSVWGVR